MITADHVKPGAAVVDVGVSRTEAGIVGDVDFDAVQAVAGAITPMPRRHRSDDHRLPAREHPRGGADARRLPDLSRPPATRSNLRSGDPAEHGRSGTVPGMPAAQINVLSDILARRCRQR